MLAFLSLNYMVGNVRGGGGYVLFFPLMIYLIDRADIIVTFTGSLVSEDAFVYKFLGVW